MAESRQATSLMDSRELVEKVSRNLGKPVLALLELPATPQEEKLISALNLEEGDIISLLDMGGINVHTWCCSVSFPPDCAIDIDG